MREEQDQEQNQEPSEPKLRVADFVADSTPDHIPYEVEGWARKMAGPWAKKRGFLKEHMNRNDWPFVDLANDAKQGPKLEWLVEGLLPTKYLAVLGGDSKSGKSWFVTALALSVATGTPFMGLAVQKRPVVWLSFEENSMERQLAFDAWFESGGAKPEPWHFMTSYERLYIDDPVGLQAIHETVWGLQAGLVVVDPLHASYSAGSLSEGSTARRVLAGMKEFTKEMNTTVLVIHHLTKQVGSGMVRERMADSGQILAAASMDWLMEVREEGDFKSEIGDLRGEGTKGQKDEGAGGEGRTNRTDTTNGAGGGGRTLRLMGRGRGAAVNRNWLIHSPAAMQYEVIGAGDGPWKNALETRIQEALSEGQMTAKRIAKRLGSPIGSVRNTLTRMSGEGLVQVAGKEGRNWVYELKMDLNAGGEASRVKPTKIDNSVSL